MGFFRKKKEAGVAATPQIKRGDAHPFAMLGSYVPLRQGEARLYRAIREAVAQHTKLRPIHSVLPLRTAPSQIMASWCLSADLGPHQPMIRRCLGEKRLIFNPRPPPKQTAGPPYRPRRPRRTPAAGRSPSHGPRI